MTRWTRPLGKAFLAVAASFTVLSSAHAADRPNVLVILADDMGFADLGCYGSEIRTPNLDRLAEDGIRFSQFYNAARCCPTRASLLTGLYPHQAGIGHMNERGPTPAYQGFLNDRCVTLAEALRPAGYFTAAVGKWHVGSAPEKWPRQRGFDRWYGSPMGGFYYRDKVGGPRIIVRDDTPIANTPGDLPEDFYSTDTFGSEAIGYIDEARSLEKPFMIYLAFVAPHFPLQAPQNLVDSYSATYRTDWDTLSRQRFQRQVKMGLIDATLEQAPREKDVPDWNSLPPATKDRYTGLMSTYAAVVEKLDENIGKVVDHLRSTGQLDNTLILVMSDNGGNAESGVPGRFDGVEAGRWGGPDTTIFAGKCWAGVMNTPFRKFKHFVHEGGIASPLIVHYPAKTPQAMRGTFYREPAHVIDILPTLVDLSGATYPEDLGEEPRLLPEGVSLMPALKGDSLKRTKPIFWEHEGNAALREGDWKLVRIEGQPWQLFELSHDRTELHDLSSVQPERRARMIAQWKQWASQVGVEPWATVR